VILHFLNSFRSWDGLTLYVASSDGTLGVFDFDSDELEGIAPHSVQEQYLQKFGFVPPPIPEGYSHNLPSHAITDSTSMRITPPPSPLRSQGESAPSQNGFGHNINGGGERVNMLVAKRKSNKKRIQPTLASSIPSASVVPDKIVTSTASGPSTGTSGSRSALAPDGKTSSLGFSRSHSHSLSPLQQSDSTFQSSIADSRPFDANNFASDIHADYAMDLDVPISSLDDNGSSSGGAKSKRKASAIDITEDTRATKPRTLGGDLTRGSVVVREISAGKVAGALASRLWGDPLTTVLPQPPLLTFLSAKIEGSDDVLEAQNPENDGKWVLVSHQIAVE
jgi:protein HIRA/HIR1